MVVFAAMLLAGPSQPAMAQSQAQAQLTVRIQELEDTVRTLTGQVEGLQFQLTQMQELIQKMQTDDEFRFQQLEGGDAKKPPQKTGEATPTQQLPPASTATTTTETAQLPPASDGDTVAAPGDDALGQSADPLVGKGGAPGQEVALGTVPEDLTSRPLDLSLDSGQTLSNGDAQAQYKAGYDAITRGDYPFAEDQFRQFISLYPKDPEAPDATNWLGEALLQRQAYDEAADVLLTGFQAYGETPRAPDLLMKLGIALAGAGEQDTACRTFFEVSKRYPKQPTAFVQRLKQEQAKAKCPA